MELLDRYLEAVRSCLPEPPRDDIINELSENLHSQIEDQEAGLGRQLTEAEVEAILKQHGHPLVVAGRYRQDQRSVAFGKQFIGPVLFPFYLRVLTFNLGLTSLILLGIFVALLLSNHGVTVGTFFAPFLYQFLIQFGVVTLIFSVADRHWKQHPDQWDPRSLKRPWHPAFAIQLESQPKAGSKKDPTRVSRFDSIAQLIALTLGLAWLRVALGAPFLIFGPAASFLKPAPVWQALYLPVVVLFLVGMLQATTNLVRPDWVRLLRVHRVVNDAAWIVILILLLRAGQWVVLGDTAGSPEGYRRTAEILNQVAVYLLAGLLALTAYNLYRDVRRLARPA
jgi:hypothetical protein